MKKPDIKRCINCDHALVPTALGWICDNLDCDYEYGLDLVRTENMETLSEALQKNIGKVSYRYNDVVNYLTSLETESETVSTILLQSGVQPPKNVKRVSDKLRFILTAKDSDKVNSMDNIRKYKTAYILIKDKWWFKLFNLFGTYSIPESPIRMDELMLL